MNVSNCSCPGLRFAVANMISKFQSPESNLAKGCVFISDITSAFAHVVNNWKSIQIASAESSACSRVASKQETMTKLSLGGSPNTFSMSPELQNGIESRWGKVIKRYGYEFEG